MNIVLEQNLGAIRILQLNHRKNTNPFSEEMETAIKAALARAEDDSSVRAIVVTGGVGRSFSAGGDFGEVKKLTGGADVDQWIDRVTDLYTAALKVSKPTIAAIDGFAIGMGFQFAMMFDWKVMAEGAEFRMPELKHGIGCSVGGAILSNMLSLNTARQIIFECESIHAQRALHYGLVDEVVPQSELMARAIVVAEKMGNYPEVAFRNTKRSVVKNFCQVLCHTAEESKKVHRAAFAAGAMQSHFQRILSNGDSAENAAQQIDSSTLC